MRFTKVLFLIINLCSYTLTAQIDTLKRFSFYTNRLSLQSGSNGKLSFVSLSGFSYWNIGKKSSHFQIGVGARYNSSFGKSSLEFITAPVKLTRERAGIAALFNKKKSLNIDSLSLNSTQINSLNLALALHYTISPNWGMELNTDVIGFSLGKEQESVLTYGERSNATRKTKANPTLFNAFLLGDNSYGSIQSSLIFDYKFRNNLFWNLGPTYLFHEYTIVDPVLYTNSSATVIGTDRYRLKSLTFAIGLTYYFKLLNHKH